MNFVGMRIFEVGQYQDAITDFTKCIAMDSTASDGYRMRGRAYYFLNQFDNASAALSQAALRIDPKDETTISFFNDLKRRNFRQCFAVAQRPAVRELCQRIDGPGHPLPQSELETEVGSQTPLIYSLWPPRHDHRRSGCIRSIRRRSSWTFSGTTLAVTARFPAPFICPVRAIPARSKTAFNANLLRRSPN